MRRFVERLLNLFRVRRPEQELTREIEAHLALLQEAYKARGMTPPDARRAAAVAIGGVEQAKELHRQARSSSGSKMRGRIWFTVFACCDGVLCSRSPRRPRWQSG